jgi:hypothetical protein
MKQFLAAFFILAVLNGAASAQQRGSESGGLVTMTGARFASEAPCDYDSCALRLTLGFGGMHVMQGVSDKKIGDIGYFSAPDIEKLVHEVPEAADAARQFRSSYRASSVLVWAGGLVAATGVGFATANNGHSVALGVGATGLAVMAYGVYRHGRSFDLLSRSIWLYNKSLKR